MNTRRKKEWFDDDPFWRELYPFMFPEKRFAAAAAQIGKVLKLTKPKGKVVLDLCCGPSRWAIPLAQKGFSVIQVYDWQRDDSQPGRAKNIDQAPFEFHCRPENRAQSTLGPSTICSTMQYTFTGNLSSVGPFESRSEKL